MATELCEFQTMGSPFQIRIDYNNKNTKAAQQHIHGLFQDLQMEVEQLEACFSRFRPDSELTRFNQRIGEFISVSSSFKHLLDISEKMYRLTDGIFDPRILQYLENIGT